MLPINQAGVKLTPVLILFIGLLRSIQPNVQNIRKQSHQSVVRVQKRCQISIKIWLKWGWKFAVKWSVWSFRLNWWGVWRFWLWKLWVNEKIT